MSRTDKKEMVENISIIWGIIEQFIEKNLDSIKTNGFSGIKFSDNDTKIKFKMKDAGLSWEASSALGTWHQLPNITLSIGTHITECKMTIKGTPVKLPVETLDYFFIYKYQAETMVMIRKAIENKKQKFINSQTPLSETVELIKQNFGEIND